MRVIETFPSLFAAKPASQIALENIGDVLTYHDTYKVRHPLAAYNTSIQSVTRRILNTLNIIEEIIKRRLYDGDDYQKAQEKLIDATDHMLDSIMEHLEDCVGIIRSFYPNSTDKKFKEIQKKYNASVEPYRQHIGKIVNYIKHNQGRIRILTFSWNSGASLGYFIEGPTSNDGLGPVSIIHENESTAFSYNRDIPYHICNIYAVSRRLATILHEINPKLSVKKSKINPTEKTTLAEVIEAASRLPCIYFEDEIIKGVPLIKNTEHSVKLDFPSANIKAKTIPGGAKAQVSYIADGYTRSYSIPYYHSRS